MAQTSQLSAIFDELRQEYPTLNEVVDSHFCNKNCWCNRLDPQEFQTTIELVWKFAAKETIAIPSTSKTTKSRNKRPRISDSERKLRKLNAVRAHRLKISTIISNSQVELVTLKRDQERLKFENQRLSDAKLQIERLAAQVYNRTSLQCDTSSWNVSCSNTDFRITHYNYA